MRAPGSSRLVGYGASVDDTCRVLVVGSMPSARSLEIQEYYGHPQNRFWSFVEDLFAIPRELPHKERLEGLRKVGVALWDVVQSCKRETSADSRIREVQVNDFVALFQKYSKIERVFCNGGKAHDLWRRFVGPQLEAPMPFERLPSTSPANASQTVARKLQAWAALRDAVADDPCRPGLR